MGLTSKFQKLKNSKIMISGIQQIGVGIPNVHEAWKWYRENFGVDVPVVDAPGTAELMLKYTDNKPQDRHAIIAVNMQGGGGLEIWQYMSRKPQPAKFQVLLGDLGIFVAKIKSNTVKASYLKFRLAETDLVSQNMQTSPDNKEHFFVTDPYNNHFQVIESDEVFMETDALTGGVYGAIIGVTDIEKSKKFYADILGYDKVLYEREGTFKDFSSLPGGENKFKRVLLTHSRRRKGAFSKFMGKSEIELVQVLDREPNKIYEDRLWGDLGFIQICYDVQDMAQIKQLCEENGHPFTVDSLPEYYENPDITFDMGEAAGHFTYIEDPDGTLIEFVQTHKIPVIKSIGWNLNLKKRKPNKPLPNWMLRTMAWNRYEEDED